MNVLFIHHSMTKNLIKTYQIEHKTKVLKVGHQFKYLQILEMKVVLSIV